MKRHSQIQGINWQLSDRSESETVQNRTKEEQTYNYKINKSQGYIA